MNHSRKYGVPRPADPAAGERVAIDEWKRVDFDAAATGCRPRSAEAGSHLNEETDMGIANPAEKRGVVQAGRHPGAQPQAGGPLLKTQAAADYLAISPRQVQYLSQRGELPYVRIGNSTRYTTADLDDFVRRCRQKGERP
jgi:excisionase family DNA binding protein